MARLSTAEAMLLVNMLNMKIPRPLGATQPPTDRSSEAMDVGCCSSYREEVSEFSCAGSTR